MLKNWFGRKMSIQKRQSEILRVQNMLLEPKKIESFYSPTLSQLQKGEAQNVKRLTSIYENIISTENDTTYKETPLTSRKNVINKEIEDDKKIEIFDSIYKRENEYTNKMQALINSYINELEFEARFMPEKDRDELIKSVFGNIKSIYNMHVEKLRPLFEPFGQPVDSKTTKCSILCDFAKKLIVLCENGDFNCYLLEALTANDTKIKRETFYNDLMLYSRQKYQFTYEFDPISQLTSYGLIFEEMMKDAKDQSCCKDCVRYMSSAVKNFNNILSNIKSVRNINPQ